MQRPPTNDGGSEEDNNIATAIEQVVQGLVDQVVKEESERGVWYIELKRGEPSGFDKGWSVDVVHAMIRVPSGGRSCIIKFKEEELSQLIDAELVKEKAPRELLIFLHKKLGFRI